MSTCISTHGEYSEHAPLDDDFCCSWCGVFNEDAAVDSRVATERDALLAKFEALADRLATYDCTDAPDDVPLFVDVPDDYEAGVHATAHDIRNLIKEARA